MAPRALRRALFGASALTLTSALVLLPALGAAAIDYDVDDSGGATYTDIQSAVNAATLAGVTAGDRVVVAAGAYAGFTVNVTGLEIVGSGPADTVVTGTVVLNGATEISGFTLQGQAAPATTTAPYAPSAIQMYAGSGGSFIHDNVIQNAYQGIYMQGADATSADPTVIEGNEFLGIHADQGSGVWIRESDNVEVTDNLFENTVADDSAVGVNVQCHADAVLVAGNEFVNLGNAVVAISAGDCEAISNLTIRNNQMSQFAGSGAIYFGGNNIVDVSIEGNTVTASNHVSGALVKVSGLSFFKSTHVGAVGIQGVYLGGNHFSGAPYGILIESDTDLASPVTLDDNTWCDISIETYAASVADLDDRGTDTLEEECLSTLPLPDGSGGGSSSGQLDTLAVTGGQPSAFGFALAGLLLLAGVGFVVRSRLLSNGRHTAR